MQEFCLDEFPRSLAFFCSELDEYTCKDKDRGHETFDKYELKLLLTFL